MLVSSLASSSGRSVQSAAEVNSPHETEDPKNKVQCSGYDEPDEVQYVSNEVIRVVRVSDVASKVYDCSDKRSNSEGELQREENHEDNHDNVVASLNVEERLGSVKQNSSVIAPKNRIRHDRLPSSTNETEDRNEQLETTLSDVQAVIDDSCFAGIATTVSSDEALSQENSTINEVSSTKGNNRAAENDDSESDRPPVRHFFYFLL